jgi:hypothetical protein
MIEFNKNYVFAEEKIEKKGDDKSKDALTAINFLKDVLAFYNKLEAFADGLGVENNQKVVEYLKTVEAIHDDVLNIAGGGIKKITEPASEVEQRDHVEKMESKKSPVMVNAPSVPNLGKMKMI